jgi:peptide/nickel transport system substrate-binding protein
MISQRTLRHLVLALAVVTAGITDAGAQEKPRYGGTLVSAMGAEPRVLNPGITTDFYDYMVSGAIYNKLVTLGPDQAPAPDLAKSWTVSEDAKTLTFKLNSGVKWHDGKPFSSADVKFSYEKIINVYHGSGAVIFTKVASIEAPDPDTVIIHLKEPSAPFLTFIARDGRILPKHLYENSDIQNNPTNLKPVGTGPFKFASWQRGSSITLERNPDYFVKGQPYLDRIVFKVIPDASARVVALESGEVDYVAASDLQSSAVERLRKTAGITVTSKGHESWAAITELMFNMDKPPLNDLKVRRAISQAINRDFIVDKASFNLNKVATGPLSSETSWAYAKDVHLYPYDVAAAEKLLDEAGFKRGADGTRFKMKVVAARGVDAFAKSAEIVAEQLKKVGIDVEVNILDRATVLNQVYTKREFDTFIHSMTSGPDPAIGVERQYISSNIRPSPFTNAVGYKNPAVDKLFADAAIETSIDKRAGFYKSAQKILTDDAVMVWLYEGVIYSAFRSEFGGMHESGPDANYDLGLAWWKKGKESR